MFRIFVERREGFTNDAARIFSDIVNFLKIDSVTELRYLNRYDVEGVSDSVARTAADRIFSEPQSDVCFFDKLPISDGETVIAWEYLPGQYDQRADSAEQCLSLLLAGASQGLGNREKEVRKGCRPDCTDVERNLSEAETSTATKQTDLFVPNGTHSKEKANGVSQEQIRVLNENNKADLSTNARCGTQSKPVVRCAKIVVLKGNVTPQDAERIQKYLINPVDSRLAKLEKPETLVMKTEEPADVPVVSGFISFDKKQLEDYRQKMGLAMDAVDIEFLQGYFVKEGRDPTETEIRVLDTYWSDHCRHTTFTTELQNIQIADGPYKELFQKSLDNYKAMRTEIHADRNKPVTLMDMATIGAKYLRKHGLLEDLEVSPENNACSVYIDVKYKEGKGKREEGRVNSECACHVEPVETSTAKTERYLLMFKNETHNHPTEIEPFGGAATCIGGAIRDPLSGRSWVYQSMRITGAADPTVPLAETLHGKLPQLKIVREAAQGFSSYGNQIGLTTGQVVELYHPGYVAKRLELGAVIAAAPAKNVVRAEPAAGDKIILLGGGTGRDGIGGATGSSKVHTEKSVTTAAAEVQKGNAVEERKIQRLFRNPEVSLMIVRSNDFGAGGVSVAVGELAPGLDINLDAVPKKYDGLNGTELAISESQERMAVVVKAADTERFIKACAAENLNAVVIAEVTDTNRLVMKWRGKTIVDIDRDFVDAAGAVHQAEAVITSPAEQSESPLTQPLESVENVIGNRPLDCARGDSNSACESNGVISTERERVEKSTEKLHDAFLANISDLACCSQRGLGERFDGSIGAATVLFPYGGRYQATPEAGMVARIPVAFPHETSTVSLMSYGFDPRVGLWSAWHGAQIAVLSSLAKIVCIGGNAKTARLSFQEFFGRAVNKETWGAPLAALLGSLDAQKICGTASIGGKDSMSGTFENINVPHTLVSFAVTHDEEKNITSGSFKKSCSRVYIITTPYGKMLEPNLAAFMQNAQALYDLNSQGKISAMYNVAAGGIAEAITKMALGNRVGVEITNVPVASTISALDGNSNAACHVEPVETSIKPCVQDLFVPQYGAIIVETGEQLENSNAFVAGTVALLGSTKAEPEIVIDAENCLGVGKTSIAISELEAAWEKTLAKVFPPVSDVAGKAEALPEFAIHQHKSVDEAAKKSADLQKTFAVSANAKPRVLIPVFPGTNCEYDLARAFGISGGDAKIMVFRNNTPEALAESLDTFAKELSQAQILALAGGFSAGDEPDGSGKFIANVLRESRIADCVMDLLKKRDGLVLGICNGFQALIKTGLVPYGEIREPSADAPTLTFNTIGRHISRVVRTRLVSAASAWAQDASVLDSRVHLVSVSHGEGRIIIDGEFAKELFEKGQIFTQYVNEQGEPTMLEPDNPNGSMFAIEGMTSPDGRVLGKMGHSERTIGTDGGGRDLHLIKNVAVSENENSCENIFAAGVRYFG